LKRPVHNKGRFLKGCFIKGWEAALIAPGLAQAPAAPVREKPGPVYAAKRTGSGASSRSPINHKVSADTVKIPAKLDSVSCVVSVTGARAGTPCTPIDPAGMQKNSVVQRAISVFLGLPENHRNPDASSASSTISAT
jgi:hypothetical protein